jgi:rhodanese-related sulfurtransferase
MGLFSFLGFGDAKIRQALQRGAVVIDVRTVYEYDQGHVRGAVNIPIDRIPANVERIKQMNKPIIFCCASGMRSGTATRSMKEKGLKDVYNGGSWEKVIRLQKSI